MVNIREKANEMGVVIVEKESIPSVLGASFQKNGKWHIMLDASYGEERKNFTIAHELAEIILYDENELTIDEKHNKANHLAAELLMPGELFRQDVFKNDLYQLKKIYNGCSYEVIARRMLRFVPLIVTIYDNKQKYLRISSDSLNFPHSPTKNELEVVEECYRVKEKTEKCEDNLLITGYYIDDGKNVERVILLTEILDI